LPVGKICLLAGFNDTNSVVSTGSSEFLLFTLALVLRFFKLSVEECIEFTILGLKLLCMDYFLSSTLKNSDRA